jgi:hypothetical protein
MQGKEAEIISLRIVPPQSAMISAGSVQDRNPGDHDQYGGLQRETEVGEINRLRHPAAVTTVAAILSQ